MRTCSPTGRQHECAPPRRGEARHDGVRARTGNGGAGCRRGCEAVHAKRASYIVGCVVAGLAGTHSMSSASGVSMNFLSAATLALRVSMSSSHLGISDMSISSMSSSASASPSTGTNLVDVVPVAADWVTSPGAALSCAGVSWRGFVVAAEEGRALPAMLDRRPVVMVRDRRREYMPWSPPHT